MLQKTHFRPRGVAKMENLHFCSGFIGTKIRALAQRGAQNSCPGTISKLFSGCILLARPEGEQFGPQWLCQGTFAYKIWVICEGTTNFTYQTNVNWSLTFDSRIEFSLLKLFYSETCALAQQMCSQNTENRRTGLPEAIF